MTQRILAAPAFSILSVPAFATAPLATISDTNATSAIVAQRRTGRLRLIRIPDKVGGIDLLAEQVELVGDVQRRLEMRDGEICRLNSADHPVHRFRIGLRGFS